jgi:hypothetical protein
MLEDREPRLGDRAAADIEEAVRNASSGSRFRWPRRAWLLAPVLLFLLLAWPPAEPDILLLDEESFLTSLANWDGELTEYTEINWEGDWSSKDLLSLGEELETLDF